MKNFVVLMLVPTVFAACNNKGKNAENKPVIVAETARPTMNTDAFNESFKKILVTYYTLKDAMVEFDTVKANAASRELSIYSESLKINELKNDSTGDIREKAKNHAGTITGSALAFVGETEMPKKKKEFQMISDALYDLVRTVKYDREKIYHEHCPMALNDSEEAYWLSNSSAISNPYLGKKHPKYKDAMVECGDVTDSLDFSK